MKKLTITQKCLMGLLLLSCLGIFALATKEPSQKQEEPDTLNNTFTISHDSGFYAEPVILEITGDTITEVYYTLDGSDPSRENPVAQLYSDGIYITLEETETVVTVRMLAYFEDGTTSNIQNRTFITGDSVKERFDVAVLSLTAPEEFFWSEEEGLLYLDHKYIMVGREYEEEVFMTLFDEGGNVLLSQNCGLRIHGKYSRAKNQVSFRLLARSEYDEQNDFEYAIFKNQYSHENTIIPEHKRLIVRNSGNDNGFAFIRSELASRLSLDAGFPDAPSSIPIAVYLNNTYYGAYWLITNFDETYYRETYGDYEGTMYTLEGAIHNLELDETETDETVISLTEDYNEKMAFFATCDLTREEHWKALNEFMDVENFLQYMAIQNYTSNTDSLKNNYKIYRYVAPEGGSYCENSVFDGRFRFLLFDLDYAFGYIHNGAVWASVDNMTTSDRVNSTEKFCAFFGNLMERKDCQEYYIRYMLSLQNQYFSYEYAGAVLDEMHESRARELRYTYTTTNLLVNNDSAPDVTSDEDIASAMDDIRSFLMNRKYYVAEDLSASFGPFTTYELLLENAGGANVSLDYATTNESYFSGMYYKEVPLTISAQAKPGYRFDYWLINGEKYEEPSFEVTKSMITEKGLSLECVSSPDPDAGIYITALKSNIGSDYIVLTNLGTTPKSLSSYYLTDDSQWNKSSLPGITLKGGESVTIYCNNYTETQALGKPCVNFNLKEGEPLSLYGSGEVQLQSVTVPSLGTEEGIYTMDMETGTFKEIQPN
ncbi:MAG: CotH kinase family protein [Lachnospiraceae bacterium]|nr:CotH kinase family protein [Lachnospiraceae bacterium]